MVSIIFKNYDLSYYKINNKLADDETVHAIFKSSHFFTDLFLPLFNITNKRICLLEDFLIVFTR